MSLSPEQILASARKCLQIEKAALELTCTNLNEGFVQAIKLIENTILQDNKLVFTGVGKNVPICLKLAGTFNSIGGPTAFLDPNQALHGDLGLCRKGDLCILISNSGETEDLLRLLPSLKRLGLTSLAITSVPDSALCQYCDKVLFYHYDSEACPLNLAPTASTTAALAIGDALAMVFLELRGLSREDFARYHPAGSLGKVLLLKVSDIMRSGPRFAKASENVLVQEALLAITEARCGSIALCDPASGTLSGVFSDGDFRRAALAHPDILSQPVAHFMTRNPRTVPCDSLAVEALKIFEKVSVDDLIVVDKNNHPVGLVDGQDMPKLKIV